MMCTWHFLKLQAGSIPDGSREQKEPGKLLSRTSTRWKKFAEEGLEKIKKTERV